MRRRETRERKGGGGGVSRKYSGQRSVLLLICRWLVGSLWRIFPSLHDVRLTDKAVLM